MISIAVLSTFFFILVLVYPAVSVILSVFTWILKKKAGTGNAETEKRISETADRIKDRVFVTSVIIVFFFIAPFAVIYLYTMGLLD